MGKVIKIACESCKSEWKCMTGCGLSHALLQDVLREFPEKMRGNIVEEAGEEAPIFVFGYQTAVCDRCRRMVGVPVIMLENSDTEYVGPCPVCGDVVSLAADINDTACPVCKSKALKAETVGNWD